MNNLNKVKVTRWMYVKDGSKIDVYEDGQIVATYTLSDENEDTTFWYLHDDKYVVFADGSLVLMNT